MILAEFKSQKKFFSLIQVRLPEHDILMRLHLYILVFESNPVL